jgi:hypothetical protein
VICERWRGKVRVVARFVSYGSADGHMLCEPLTATVHRGISISVGRSIDAQETSAAQGQELSASRQAAFSFTEWGLRSPSPIQHRQLSLSVNADETTR